MTEKVTHLPREQGNAHAEALVPQRVLREHELPARDGLQKTHRATLISRGEYPAPIRISARRKVWLESEIAQWQAARIAASRKVQR